jgi:hypothetical protein
METDDDFYFTYEEICGIVSFSLQLFEKRLEAIPKKIEHETEAQSLFNECYHGIRMKVDKTMTDEGPENIPFGIRESFLLQNIIAEEAVYLKRLIQESELSVNETKFTPMEREEVEENFDYMKENSIDLLWRLTIFFNYNRAGLDALETAFEIKTGVVRQLEVDKTIVLTTIPRRKENMLMFKFLFKIIDMLQEFQDENDFARNIFRHQYLNMSDYLVLRDKILGKGRKIKLTLYDNIILYWTVSLGQRIFVTDAADILNSMVEQLPEFKEFRKVYFSFCKYYVEHIRDALMNNDEFRLYMDQVNHWKF